MSAHADTVADPLHADLAQPAKSSGEIVEARQAPAPVVASADPMVAMIERMASDPSIDLDRVRTVLDLRRSMKEEAARESFNISLAACKAEIPQVTKNAKNTDNNARYATLDQMGDAIDRVIAKHGFSTSFHPAPTSRDGFLKVVCLVGHTGGHERMFEAELPIDATGLKGGLNKTPIHAWKSTMTYGRRVLTEMIFDVKSRDSDDDGNAAGGKAPTIINDDQVAELRSLIIEANPDPKLIPQFIEDMLGYLKAASIEAMTIPQFTKARAGIRKQIADEQATRKPDQKGRAA